jgi:hypothetical protein
MRCYHLEALFENLGENDYDHNDVSPALPTYNCIAWAAGDMTRRWWPFSLGGFWWPPELPPDEETLDNFIRAFELLGYRKCKTSAFKKGIEKVALFVDNKGVPTHAARQRESGDWTSKCGPLEDIQHKTLHAVEGVEYGTVAVFLKRRKDRKPFLRDRILLLAKRFRLPF